MLNIKIRELPGNARKRNVRIRNGTSVERLLEELGIYPDTVVVSRKGAPVPITEILKDGDELDITRVVSGG